MFVGYFKYILVFLRGAMAPAPDTPPSHQPVTSHRQYSAYVADVAARTAGACVRGGLPLDALEAAVLAACLAIMDAPHTRRPPTKARSSATLPTPPPPTTYGHMRRRQQLRRERQELVHLHVSQSQARYTVGKEEAVELQRMLITVGSALREMMSKNERKLRAGVGRAQTAARSMTGADQRMEFEALRRREFSARQLSRGQQRDRVRAEFEERETRRMLGADTVDVAGVGRARVADDEPKRVADDAVRYDTVEELPTLEGDADDLADGERDRAAEFTLAFWPESEEAVADEEHRRVAVERCQRQARAASERAERAQRKALLDEDEDDAMVDKDILGSGGDPTLDTPYA